MGDQLFKIAGVIFVFFMIGAVMYRELKDMEMKANKVDTIAELVSFANCGIPNCYDYRYVVNDSIYYGTLKSSVLLSGCGMGGPCSGRKFKCSYSKVDPANSILDLNMEYSRDTIIILK